VARQAGLNMTLRMKALVAVAIALIASAALIYGVSNRIMVREMLSIESDQMTRNVSVVQRAIEREKAELDARVFDYAAWDDTYAFMEEPDPEYIRTNLPDNVYESLQISLIAFVRPDGTLTYGRLFDLDNVGQPLGRTRENRHLCYRDRKHCRRNLPRRN
jgi:sensor domain CHASE-containing protein